MMTARRMVCICSGLQKQDDWIRSAIHVNNMSSLCDKVRIFDYDLNCSSLTLSAGSDSFRLGFTHMSASYRSPWRPTNDLTSWPPPSALMTLGPTPMGVLNLDPSIEVADEAARFI